MADTSIATGSALTQKLWDKAVIFEAMKYLYFKRFSGPGMNNIFEEKDDLSKKKGDRITYQLFMKLANAPSLSGSTLELNEEALVPYSDTVTVELMRNGVRLDGELTEQRVVFNLQETARQALAIWLAETIDSYCFRFLWGDTTLTFGETAQAPEATAIVYAGDATSTSDIDASDTYDLTLMDACKEKAITRDPMVRPLNVDGDEVYINILHPFQITDIRSNTAAGQWQDYQKYAAAQDGQKNPIFTGANAMYNGVLIHSHRNIHTVTNWGAGSNVNGAEGLFCGKQTGCIAWAKKPFWRQKLFDYQDKAGFACGAILGINKTIFNSLDYAVFVVRSAAVAHS